MRMLTISLMFAAACPALAQGGEPARVVDAHILPGYERLAEETRDLADTAKADCAPESDVLRDAYGQAFDAWVSVSHLRFGPSEVGDRAFALAFWPDTRGKTPKALGEMIRTEDEAATAGPEAFANVSIAARGFYALEYLLYDTQISRAGTPEYRCALVRALTTDIAAGSEAIRAGWQDGYADLMRGAGQNETYRTPEEATRQLFTALTTGLEFASDTRLGRPLGTFDRPRPNRAEARRSGRSLRHVTLSLEALRDLAGLLSGGDADLDHAFVVALDRARLLDDPVFAGAADPQARFRIEALKQSIDDIRQVVSEELGPRLGIAAGFNSMDGD